MAQRRICAPGGIEPSNGSNFKPWISVQMKLALEKGNQHDWQERPNNFDECLLPAIP